MKPKLIKFDGKVIGLYWQADKVDQTMAELWLSSDFKHIRNSRLHSAFNEKYMTISKNINQSWLDCNYGGIK